MKSLIEIRAKKAAYMREWSRKNPDKKKAGRALDYERHSELYKQRAREYKLADPERHRRMAKDYRENNKEYLRHTKALANHVMKMRVIVEYGSKCACCGEKNPKFLTMDHINNDGTAHRKGEKLARRIYAWAIRNNFPKDRLQLLCWNCNEAKRFYATCPHQHNYTLHEDF